MANWCSNFITIIGKPVQLKRAVELVRADESPCGDVDLCWPTDTGRELVQLPPDEETEISFSCQSRWAPPVEWFVQLCGELDVVGEVEYEESGMDFGGVYRVCREGEQLYGQDHMASYFEWRYATSDDHENDKELWVFAHDLESLSDEEIDARWEAYTKDFAESREAFVEAHQAERKEIKRDVAAK